MPDRTDLAAAALGATSLLATAAYAILVPTAFTNGLPNVASYLLLSVPVYSYAAYWSVSIRNALAAPLYRRQSLGIGLVTIAIWGVVLSFVLLPNGTSSPATYFLNFSAFDLLFIVLFYWIDASVRTSRRSDPLVRDTLYWSKIRIPLWIAIIVTTLIPLLILGYVGVTSNTTVLNQLNEGTFGGPVVTFALNVVTNFSVIIPICGIIYLPLIAARSKWNRNLRNHFLWFAPASVGVLLIFFGPSSGSTSLAGNLISGFLLVLVGYSLYRSAKALVPLNRVSSSPTD
jgi:hypothetical protein